MNDIYKYRKNRIQERLSLEGGKWNYIFHLDFESVFIIHTNNKFSQFTLEVTMAGIHVPGERSRPSFLRQIYVISRSNQT